MVLQGLQVMTTSKSDWDIDLRYGQDGEESVRRLLTMETVEVKSANEPLTIIKFVTTMQAFLIFMMRLQTHLLPLNLIVDTLN